MSTDTYAGMRPQDWTGIASLVALGSAATAMATGRRKLALRLGATALVADLASRRLSRRYPSPFRARFRFALVHTAADRRRLLRILEPCPGEQILELGPGAGHHAVDVATVLDIQPEMLTAVEQRARASGIDNVTAAVGHACRRLPYDDGTFDRAYLNSVLGELPDQDAALRELRRVLKDGGRLVVGEILFDPDFVSLRTLLRRAEAAGFVLDSRAGSPVAYLARLRTA